ncbi:MAG TPA: adenylate/guanylate cyclase domain-containing protein [Candidatus Eremiobacteraceae bacterium]|nr:adenylate/guanylate cyclase domain-containing protein [Candidatus Eremiobacteraceae bacterium]
MQPAAMPTGFVAFLFTDIEGSTKRWEQKPDAMKTAVARHEVLIRQAVMQSDGYVFKTVGDAFCAAFHSPHQAVRAALAAQRALHAEDFSAVDGLKVRIGIHVGQAEERDGDYFGPTVNRVARLMSIGHGGQVLVSDAVREQIRAQVPLDATLTDLGLRRLKDLMRPERVWGVTVAGLPSEFAPLTSLDARPNNLPVQTTALLGRDDQLGAIKQLMTSRQFVTICGAGGVGKTRCAVQVGADLIDHFEHGVWFADLAPISDAGLVPSVIAQALEINQSGDSVEASVLKSLKRKQLLLILDNCEHLLESTAPFADAILKNCPQIQVLATSRQPLGIAGEFVHRLPSLEVPDASTTIGADDVLRFGATALFAERAAAADNRFVLTADTAPIVADICRRLDGIPLAIELAAARVKVLSLRNLAVRVDERFKILTGGNRTALPRQKTLSALIDWSYGLLDAREQALFNRLGIFAGGFGLDAATAICSDDFVDAADVLDLLSSLIDKSLVSADTSRDHERYRLLESTRAYAIEKLRAFNQYETLSSRHAEFFRQFARAAYANHRTRPSDMWLPDQEPDLDNLRSALGWALQMGRNAELGADIAGACVQLWSAAGLAAEARSWITLALERIGPNARGRVAATLWLAGSTLGTGEKFYEMAVRARDGFEQEQDEAGIADALYSVAWQGVVIDHIDEADGAAARALEIYRRCGPELLLARCLSMQGVVAQTREDYDTARSLLREALARFRNLGDDRRVGGVLTNLGGTEFLAGDLLEAQRCFVEAFEILSHRRNAVDLAIVRGNMAMTLIALDDIAGAREAARAAIGHAIATRDEMYIADATIYLACVAARSDRMAEAARLLGFCRRQYESAGLPNRVGLFTPAKWLTKWLMDRFDAAEIERLESEGAAWPENRAVEEAYKA